MTKRKRVLKGDLPQMPEDEIYLNVSKLNKGNYKLKIVDNNKLIKKTRFKK